MKGDASFAAISMKAASVEPCVKGNTLALLVEEARRALTCGSLSWSSLRTLSAPLQEVVAHCALPTEWYPVRYYADLADLLCTTSAVGREDYLRELGVTDFARLRSANTYRQLGYVTHVAPKRELQTKLHDSKLITSLMASIFNFSTWAPAPDPKSPEHVVIQVTDAKHIPEAFRVLTEGFQTALNRTINPSARAVRSERPSPDVIIFRSNGSRPARSTK